MRIGQRRITRTPKETPMKSLWQDVVYRGASRDALRLQAPSSPSRSRWRWCDDRGLQRP
jgi:hypothetical protein